MSPFRAIRRKALDQLGMREETYGWNLEMQMSAARAGLRILEVPVKHRRRAGGESKVSGTLRGTFLAAERIMTTLVRVALEPAQTRKSMTVLRNREMDCRPGPDHFKRKLRAIASI